MKKLLLSLGAIAITLTLFAGGIFAYQYLTFTGTEQAEQTNNNSSEMLQIIKDLSADANKRWDFLYRMGAIEYDDYFSFQQYLSAMEI